MGLLPEELIRETPKRSLITEHSNPLPSGSGEWITFVQLAKLDIVRAYKGASIDRSCLRVPGGEEIPVGNWAYLFLKTAEWLAEQGLLSESICPFRLEGMTRYLIHSEPAHSNGRRFGFSKQLSNGLYLECHFDPQSIARYCGRLVAAFGQDPAQFHVRLG